MNIYRAFLLTAAIAASVPVNTSTNIYFNKLEEKDYGMVSETVKDTSSNLEYIDPLLEEPYIESPYIESTYLEAPLEYFPLEEAKQDIIPFSNYKLILRQDVLSEDVLKLKKFLLQKGYIEKAEGYYFDSLLKEAVINYQRDNNLVADGIVGTNTFNFINEDMKKNGILISDRMPYFSSEVPKGQWIFINKSSNTLYFLQGQEVINKYNVATGKTQLDTPEGKFSIVVKLVNPAWGGAGRYEPIRGGDPSNPLGKRWLGLNIGGGGEYGIHGNAAYNSIGKYVSLGCIRMYNEDVESLFARVAKGTPVWIGNEYKLQEFGIGFQ